MTPTWDEYLVELSDYLSAVRWAAEVGTGVAPTAPTRPTEPMPASSRDQAERLRGACDVLAGEMAARLALVRGRSPSGRPRPHEVARPANYVQTNL